MVKTSKETRGYYISDSPLQTCTGNVPVSAFLLYSTRETVCRFSGDSQGLEFGVASCENQTQRTFRLLRLQQRKLRKNQQGRGRKGNFLGVIVYCGDDHIADVLTSDRRKLCSQLGKFKSSVCQVVHSNVPLGKWYIVM